MIRMFLAVLCLAFPACVLGKSITVNPDRLIPIKGSVDGRILGTAAELVKMADESREPIYLLITSPGGSVYPGLVFISAMKMAQARGIQVICVVPVLAASMAFQFLAECSERYVLKYTLLLWHPMKAHFGVPLSGDDLIAEGEDIQQTEAYLILRLLRALKISKEVFFYHYKRETLWTAERLDATAPGFLTIVDDIAGADGLFGGLE